VRLSGRQRPPLAIARPDPTSPAIRILDEATSNLDTERVQLIQAAMADPLAGRTHDGLAARLLDEPAGSAAPVWH